MGGIIFSENSAKNNAVFGKCQAPIQMFLEQRGEAFQQLSLLPHMFKMGKSENFGDMLTTMTAMNGFKPVGENGAYPKDEMEQGYDKLLQYETWKDSFAVSQEMVEDGKLMNLTQRPEQFISAYYRTRERFGASLYGAAIMGATHSTFEGKKWDVTGADGVCVFHTGHKPKVKGGTQCNKFKDAFSTDALTKAEAAMHLFKGDNNEVLAIAPTTIIIGEDPDLKKEVFGVIGADKDPATSNNAFNYHFGRWTVIVNPYLNEFITGTDHPWILMDSRYNDMYGGAVWNDRLPLTIKSYIDNGNDANVWNGRSRFNAVFNDWRFACLGGVSSGTAL